MAKEKKPPSPITLSIAGGLFTGLGFSVVAPKIWNNLEHSQSGTILVIAVGFVLGAGLTYMKVRKS